jgi:cystathionine beta-lyase family protein involved in aluminum resistance
MYVVHGTNQKLLSELNKSHRMTMYIQECFDTLSTLLGKYDDDNEIYMEYDLQCDKINIVNLNKSIIKCDADRIHNELEKVNLKILRVYSNPNWYCIEITNNVFCVNTINPLFTTFEFNRV